jgi:hypothetical protein
MKSSRIHLLLQFVTWHPMRAAKTIRSLCETRKQLRTELARVQNVVSTPALLHVHVTRNFPEHSLLPRDYEARLRGLAERTETAEADNAALRARAELAERRLHWLHDCSSGTTDGEGLEWGIYRVKWANGQATEVWATLSDFSDLDAEMERESQARAALAQLPRNPRLFARMEIAK